MTRRKPVDPALLPTDFQARIAGVATRFKGQGTELESAIGMLAMGHIFGWRVLYIMHSVATVKKYAEILGIEDVKAHFPEDTSHSDRSLGYRIARQLSNFWRVVRGLDTVEGARNKMILGA